MSETDPQKNEPAVEAHTSNVAVIIPALNEEDSIGLVLGDLPSVGQVWVVDNGSTDATARVAEQAGASVVVESKRGYGAACLRGMTAIRQRMEAGEFRPNIVVFVDADYSDHPNLLTELIRPIVNGDADFVLGSRLLGEREPGAMPPQSIYGNKLACGLMRVFFGAKFTDLGPFRAIAYDRLLDLEMEDQNFGWTIEMQIKAVRANLKWMEIPVPYRRRVGVSKISGTVMGTIKAGSKILYTIAKYGLRRRKSVASKSLNRRTVVA